MNSNKPILCVCDSECEITYVLETYSAATVVTWAELNSLSLSKLKALLAAKSSTTGKYLGEDSVDSVDKLIEQILKNH
tara:strand:- start:259 stop:492 length:234 start_codon:yes stop_codon:yes gene_type:complete